MPAYLPENLTIEPAFVLYIPFTIFIAHITGQNGGGSNSDRNPFGLIAAPGYMVFFSSVLKQNHYAIKFISILSGASSELFSALCHRMYNLCSPPNAEVQ
jgi:hypothetical protein